MSNLQQHNVNELPAVTENQGQDSESRDSEARSTSNYFTQASPVIDHRNVNQPALQPPPQYQVTYKADEQGQRDLQTQDAEQFIDSDSEKDDEIQKGCCGRCCGWCVSDTFMSPPFRLRDCL